ncbi:MAG: DUF2178 domain-containing protein [Methanobacterium sp.]|jgi:uncharacterized membrane protein
MKNEENEIYDDKKNKNSIFKYLQIIRIILLIPVVLLIIWGIINGNLLTVIFGVALSFIISYPFKRKIRKEFKVKDERAYYISEKASRQTLFVFTIMVIYLGIILDTLSYRYPQYTPIGITLNISGVVIIIIYAVFYTYNKRKYG